MARATTEKKHAAINKRIEELKAEKFRNKPKYRIDVILNMVADEFYLAPVSVTNIYYKPKNKI